MSEHRDLTLLALGAVVLAALALAVPVDWLSLVLLAPLAFFLTGRALVAASFVQRPPDWPQTLALSVGLSLAVLALLSLPLNYLGGLTPGSWALGLVLVAVIACAVAAARRPGGWRDPRELPRMAPIGAPSAALGIAGLLAAVAAIVLAFTPLSASHAVGFTALWMRPGNGAAGGGVRVGVGSEEKQRTSYRLQVRFAGQPTPTAQRIVLDPGETKVLRLSAEPQPAAGRPLFVESSLYLSGEPDHPYRRVYGWVPAGGG